MDKFIINGPTELNGDIEISGSKNAALPILTACLAFPGIYKLKNIPKSTDLLRLYISKEDYLTNKKPNKKRIIWERERKFFLERDFLKKIFEKKKN